MVQRWSADQTPVLRLLINFTEEDTEAKQDSPDRRRTAWTQGKLGGGWPPLGLRGYSSSLPRMESTSESSKIPTHPTQYKGLAPINLYINDFYKLFRTCLWMGQGVGGGGYFRFQDFAVLGDAIPSLQKLRQLSQA